MVTIRKIIGEAKVEDGIAELDWNIDETIIGHKKIYCTYIETDGYMACEAWEDAYIKIPTTIEFLDTENEFTIIDGQKILYINCPENGSTETIEKTFTVSVKNKGTQDEINEGNVLFQTRINGVVTNIGPDPVSVQEGRASITYNVPQNTEETEIEIIATYLTTDTYSTSQTLDTLTLHTRGKIIPTLTCTSHINKGENVVANLSVENKTGNNFTIGPINYYIDDTLIDTIEEITQQGVGEITLTLPEDITYGNHEIKFIYEGTNLYESFTAVSPLYIRQPVQIEESIVYAPQTLTDDEGVEHVGVAHIPVHVTTIGNDGTTVEVVGGQIEFTVNNNKVTIPLSNEGRCDATYNIPPNTPGGTEIPFTIKYIEDNNYMEQEISSKIIVEYKTTIVLNVEGEWETGNTITLQANVTDELNNPVNKGNVTFELETEENNEAQDNTEETPTTPEDDDNTLNP